MIPITFTSLTVSYPQNQPKFGRMYHVTVSHAAALKTLKAIS